MDKGDYTILVAEDEQSSQLLYYEELIDEGYRVLIAGNGLQVLGTLEDERVDLLMTDIKMPDMHALEMIPRVREEHPDLPILVLSAFKEMERDPKLLGFGIQGFFPKPVDLRALKKRIEEILRERTPARRRAEGSLG